MYTYKCMNVRECKLRSNAIACVQYCNIDELYAEKEKHRSLLNVTTRSSRSLYSNLF